MPTIRLETCDDSRLEPYRNLKSSNARRGAGRFVVEGRLLVQRLLASDFQVHSLLVDDRSLAELDESVVQRCDVLVLPHDGIEQVVGFNFHRGMLACAQRKPNPDLAALCGQCVGPLTLAVCPDVQDPVNLGSILRIASAFGVQAVALGSACADPFSRRALRVSMGASLHVPVAVTDNLAAELVSLRDSQHVELWATVVDADATPFDQPDRPQRLAILFGSEGLGLAPRWRDLCDRLITVPMRPGIDSLNVSVAAGIVLYHLTR
jgi:tRNA G18 (ribose-2'-O)-methylase SpoU